MANINPSDLVDMDGGGIDRVGIAGDRPIRHGVGTRRPQKPLLVVQGRGEPTGLARDALAQVTKDVPDVEGLIQDTLELLDNKGATGHVEKLTTRLDAGQLGTTQRILLAWPGVYARIIKSAADR